jgi:MFS family permease
VLRHRQFAAFFAAAAISNGAGWMQLVAVPALLFELTGRATWLGYSSMAALMPALVLTPYAGVLADRVSRRAILIVTQTVQMASTTAMWVLYITHSITPLRIIALTLVVGVAAGFQTSAWQSFVPSLVPAADMLDAVKLNSIQYTLARAIGPATAGIVVHEWGVGAAILVNAATYPLVIAVLVVCRPRQHAAPGDRQPMVTALLSGARYVWGRPPLRLAVCIGLVSAMCAQSLQHVAPAISRRVLGRTSADNAGLLTALGVGALAASAVSAMVGDRVSRSRQLQFGLSMYGLSIVILSITSSYRVGQLAYAISGLGHLTVAVALNTLMQGAVPDEMRGRAVSFHLLGIIGGIPIGAFAMGRIGDAFGMRTALIVDATVFAGLLALLTAKGWLQMTNVAAIPSASSPD